MTLNNRYVLWLFIAGIVLWMGWGAIHNSRGGNKHLMVQVCLFAGAAMYDRIAIKRQEKREKSLAGNPCPGCGHSLTGLASGACPNCGRQFHWKCPQCQEPIASDSARCDKCGCE